MAQRHRDDGTELQSPVLDEKQMRQAFFSQLRHLCRDVEEGIEALKRDQDQESRLVVSSEDSISARNLVLHTIKELKELKVNTQAQYKDFVVESSRTCRIHDLMKSLIQIYGERLEKVESFIEKYGYVRPESSWRCKAVDKELLDASAEEEEEKSDREMSGSEAESAEDGVDKDIDAGAKTPPKSEQDGREARLQNLLLTPKFEDFCSGMSEATLLILQGASGVKTTSQDSESAVPMYSALRSPEPPALLTLSSKLGGDNSNIGGSSGTSVANSGVTEFGKAFRKLSTPQTPEHIKQIISSMKKPPKPSTSSADTPGHHGKLATPETPEHIKQIISSLKKPPNPVVAPAHLIQTLEDSCTAPTGYVPTDKLSHFTPLKPRNALSTPETPESVRHKLSTMKNNRDRAGERRDFREQQEFYNADLCQAGKSHHLSTPEPPTSVTGALHFTKKSQTPLTQETQTVAQTSLHDDHRETHLTSIMPPITKSLFLSTPQTPECVKRLLQASRPMESPPDKSEEGVPPALAADSCDTIPYNSHGTMKDVRSGQDPFSCSAASLDVLTSGADSHSRTTRQPRNKNTRIPKSAKSLFASPDAHSVKKPSTSARQLTLTRDCVNKPDKENTYIYPV